MKTLILILCLTTALFYGDNSNAQVTVSGTVDGVNLFKGSAPTQYEPALNYMVSINSVTKAREIGIYFEHFNDIHFVNFGIRFNYRLVDYNEMHLLFSGFTESVHFLTGFQAGQIIRSYPGMATVSYLNGGGVMELRYFKGKIGIAFIITYIYRTDQQYWNANPKGVVSVFGGLVYKFPKSNKLYKYREL